MTHLLNYSKKENNNYWSSKVWPLFISINEDVCGETRLELKTTLEAVGGSGTQEMGQLRLQSGP